MDLLFPAPSVLWSHKRPCSPTTALGSNPNPLYPCFPQPLELPLLGAAPQLPLLVINQGFPLEVAAEIGKGIALESWHRPGISFRIQMWRKDFHICVFFSLGQTSRTFQRVVRHGDQHPGWVLPGLFHLRVVLSHPIPLEQLNPNPADPIIPSLLIPSPFLAKSGNPSSSHGGNSIFHGAWFAVESVVVISLPESLPHSINFIIQLFFPAFQEVPFQLFTGSFPSDLKNLQTQTKKVFPSPSHANSSWYFRNVFRKPWREKSCHVLQNCDLLKISFLTSFNVSLLHFFKVG